MNCSKGTILPYGGQLVNRFIQDEKEKEILQNEAQHLEKIHLPSWILSDLELITFGALSPLQGFMTKDVYQSVLECCSLPDGLPWTIPITIPLKPGQEKKVGPGSKVALVREMDNRLVAIMEIEDVYHVNKITEVKQVFGTTDKAHPGVKRVLDYPGDYYAGGIVKVFERPVPIQFAEYHRDPETLRNLFASLGWKTVVAFQTRNPIHRAHEYLQKCALEMVDGLLIHPIVGDTKKDDVPSDVRMKCYEALIKNYFPPDRVLLSVLPMAMRYAGPMEAIHHCIVRRNYGATHFIIGRDHAGVGNYYGSFDAHKIFDRFDVNKLGIVPIFFDNAFFCRKCDSMATKKTCGHPSDFHITFSGTRIREMLQNGIKPPPEFTRDEIANVLIEAYSNNPVMNKKNET